MSEFPDEDAESDLYEMNMTAEMLAILLQDRRRGGNILWATDEYAGRGGAFAEDCEMRLDTVIGRNAVVLLPQVLKTLTIGADAAFPPAWLCNAEINRSDMAWFVRKDVFNIPTPDHTWQATAGKIEFPPSKTWEDYVDCRCLEIACGEAQHLVSRYDSVSGDIIPEGERVGYLDRKLRVVGERTQTEEGWFEYALRAYKSTYGCERRGDNLLLARLNLFWTFDDYYWARWQDVAGEEQRLQIADVISRNLWQMPSRAEL